MIGQSGFVERRTDHERRARVEGMTRDELIQELLTDSLTGLGNRRAYDEADRQAIQVCMDVDSLKWVNDHLGHAAGDALLRAVAVVLKAHGITAYRIGGDEFIAEFEDARLAVSIMLMVQEAMRTQVWSFIGRDERCHSWRGAEISYGIGRNIDLADRRLQSMKRSREMVGRRAPRGVRPPGLVELTSRVRINSPVRHLGWWIFRRGDNVHNGHGARGR